MKKRVTGSGGSKPLNYDCHGGGDVMAKQNQREDLRPLSRARRIFFLEDARWDKGRNERGISAVKKGRKQDVKYEEKEQGKGNDGNVKKCGDVGTGSRKSLRQDTVEDMRRVDLLVNLLRQHDSTWSYTTKVHEC